MAGTPVELSQWEYRWEHIQQWQKAPSNHLSFKRPPQAHVLFLRTPLPVVTPVNPSLFLEGFQDKTVEADRLDIYLNDHLLYQAKGTARPPRPSFVASALIPVHVQAKNAYLTFRLETFQAPEMGVEGRVIFGTYRDILKLMVYQGLDVLLLGCFFIILGVALIAVLPLSRPPEFKSLSSLAAFSLLLGLWSILSYPHLPLLFFESPFGWFVLKLLSTMLTPAAFGYFFEQIFGVGPHRIVRRSWQFFLGFLGFQIALTTLNNCLHGSLSWLHASSWVIFSGFFVAEILLFFVLAILQALKGDVEARIFSIGMSIFAFFVLVFAYDFYFVSFPHTKPFLITWGAFFFILSLILMIGRRFAFMQRELGVQNDALAKMWQELHESRDTIADWNRTLEEKVEERTRLLENTHEELTVTLDNLRETQTQLIQTEKMVALGNLVAGITQEVNTPIGVGVTAASHLRHRTEEFRERYAAGQLKKSELDRFLEGARESTTLILTNLKRAAELVKSFKLVASDQSSERRRRFNLREYLDEVILSLRPQLKHRSCEITIDCEEDFEIDSYPGAFAQIVTNLVLNTLQHAYLPGDEMHLSFVIRREGDWVKFIYGNDGRGISPEDLIHIFEPFFTTQRNEGRTGLGLPIVYNLVTGTFGGRITCESVPGKTSFIIDFPYRVEEFHAAP